MQSIQPRKKIIIFSLVYLPEYVGGAEIAIDQITKQKELAAYDFHMVTLGGFSASDRKVGAVTVHYTGLFGTNKLLFTISKFLFIITAPLKYVFLNKTYKFDMIWALMANYAGLGASIAKSMHAKNKLLLTIQEGDTIAHIMKRARLIWSLFKKLFIKADNIQVISKFLKDFSLHILGKTEDEKIVIIPNGVDLEAFTKTITTEERAQIRNEFGFVDTDKVIVTTSRLTLKNGVDTLIDTLALLPEGYKLLIIGAGPDEAMLKDKTQTLGLTDRVRFAGRKPYEELYKYLKSSEVFARLSRSEGFGNSFIEAMAARIPVVGTDVGGIVDFLENDVNGYMVRPEDPQAARDALVKATTTLTSTLTDAAYTRVQERYQWSTVASQFDNLFKKIL